MNRSGRLIIRSLIAVAVVAATTGLIVPTNLVAAVVTLRNGIQLEGRLGKIGKLGDSPIASASGGGEIAVKQIVLVDDELRRTFVSSIQVQAVAESAAVGHERIRTTQRVATGGRRIAGVGPIVRVTPFDEWGRRIFTMNTPRKQVSIVQGITEVTPTYCKVEGLQGTNAYVWDMRIATSSIPAQTLSRFLMHHLDPENPDDRLRIVRLYIQAERYRDAGAELEKALKDFPELAELRKTVVALRQASAQRLIEEVKLRRDAGQHGLAMSMLRKFPSEGVAGETLIEVRDMLGEYGRRQQQREQVLELIETLTSAVEDDDLKKRLEGAVAEIATELSFATLDRMADFLRLADDALLGPQEKLALAISGWLLGSGSGTENLAVALSAYRVRDLVRDYLRAERQHERDRAIAALQGLEASSPSYLAKIVGHMTPAIETKVPPTETPGMWRLSVPGLTGEPDIAYYVQLPQEYNPHRRYPCVVTLNGAGTTPPQQIDWWAGSYSENANSRLGQASRRGYVVIAPVWTRPGQRDYEFTAREHAAVIYSLRDACRRISIDTDRVFLSGHSMGGTAAWDMGLAHPDLWAGVIPIVPTADKFISRYWENGRGGAFYFVGGEKDGDKMAHNGPEMNRYMIRPGYDVMVVQYRGRGHEHFHDEIQRLFDWMELHRRDFFPQQFKCVAMRPWDNFFWWAELSEYPPKAMVAPLSWPPKSGVRPVATEGKVLATNGLTLRTGADRATIWLSPEIIDFNEQVMINGRRASVAPTAEVLLDDVRTRGDRQHPFWAKVELHNGRVR